MQQTLEELTQSAIDLPPEQRFTLARHLLESVEPSENTDVDMVWELQIRKRVDRFDRGETHRSSAAEAFAA